MVLLVVGGRVVEVVALKGFVVDGIVLEGEEVVCGGVDEFRDSKPGIGLVIFPGVFVGAIGGVGEVEVPMIKPAVFGRSFVCFGVPENKNKPLMAANQEKITIGIFVSIRLMCFACLCLILCQYVLRLLV